MSAKSSANIEDLFNKVIDELISTQKKKEVVSTNATTVAVEGESKSDRQPTESKTGKSLKLNSIDSKGGQKKAGGCCQK